MRGGEGFTEWTNTRKARALYPKHHQPNEPLNEYYYDLTSSAQIAAGGTAKTYGIYGFCYYHYWFRGKRLLETPINQVMSSKEPDLPFCFRGPMSRGREDGMAEISKFCSSRITDGTGLGTALR